MLREKRRTDCTPPCLLFVPDGGADESGRPLIIFLHGVRESGRSLDDLKAKSLPYLAAENLLPEVGGREFPFVVACPQTASRWREHFDDITALADELVETEGVDPGRCYLTGVSMGAIASWPIAARDEGRFAAIVPVSGSIPEEAAVSTPAWVFTGGRDQHFAAENVMARLEARRPAGAVTELTIDPEGGHDCAYWNSVYGRADLYEWLLAYRAGG